MANYKPSTVNTLSVIPLPLTDTLLAGAETITQQVATSGSPTMLTLTGAAHTTLTASTEAIDVNANLARTVQFATGDFTTQRAVVFQAPTYGFVGASTLTNAATVAITAAPTQGTNATLTNKYSLWIQAGTMRSEAGAEFATASAVGTTVTSNTQLLVLKASGAGNNWFQVRTAGQAICTMTEYVVQIAQGGTITQQCNYYRKDEDGAATAGITFGYGRIKSGAAANDTYSQTSGNATHVTFQANFTPGSGTGSTAFVQLNPTINGTSTGNGTNLAIASVTNTLTGGATYLIDAGTSTTDYFTGFTRQFAIKTDGSVGFFGATPAAKQVSGANVTNSVTVGGTTDTINNVAAASVDTSAAKLTDTRDAIYQLARKVQQINDALRLYGLLT